jgi:hypothetical protein
MDERNASLVSENLREPAIEKRIKRTSEGTDPVKSVSVKTR